MAGISGSDVRLTIGATEYGFMLVRDKNKKPAWRVTNAPVTAARIATEGGYGALMENVEMAISQSDWRGGMGQYFHNASKPNLFWYGVLDTRWKDRLMQGPTWTSTDDGGASLANGTSIKFLEFLDSLWLAHATYIYKWDTTGLDWDGVNITTTITDAVTFKGFMLAALGGSTQYQQSKDGTTWTATTLTNFKADKFAVVGNLIYKAIKPNKVMKSYYGDEVTAPSACTAALIEVAGNIDAGSHSYKVVWSDDRNRVSVPSAASDAITHDGTHKQSSLTNIPVYPNTQVTKRQIYRNKVAAQNTWYLLTTLTDNTTTTYTDNTADAALGVAASDVSTIFNPWITEVTVGDTETDITGMVEFQGSLFVGKEEGLYRVDADNTVVPITTEFRYARSTKNFTKMVTHKGKLYYNIGTQALFVYDGNSIKDITWKNNFYFMGDIGALIPSYEYLYVSMDAISITTKSAMFSVNEEVVNGELEYRWHQIGHFFTAPNDMHCGIVSSVNYTNPRLWWSGRQTNTNAVYPTYSILPKIGVEPDLDTGYSFYTTEDVLYTSRYDFGFRTDSKIFTSIDILYSLPTGNKITVDYSVDDAAAVALADLTTTTTKIDTRYINATGRYIRFILGMDSDATSETPIIYGIVVRAILRPVKKKVFDFSVYLSDFQVAHRGYGRKYSIGTLITQLRNANDPATQTGVVTLKDMDGTSYSVVIDDLQEEWITDEPTRKPERVFHIRAIEAKVA